MSDDHAPPQDGLDPDEPTTPTWLTLLGGGLFLLLALFLVATRSSGDESSAASPDASAAPAASAAPTEAP